MIENLGLFFYVVDSGGFTQASRRTGIGKATISRRISELEQELAVALLHRNARQLVMTEAGERLFIRARTIVEEAEAAKSEALERTETTKSVAGKAAAATTMGRESMAARKNALMMMRKRPPPEKDALHLGRCLWNQLPAALPGSVLTTGTA